MSSPPAERTFAERTLPVRWFALGVLLAAEAMLLRGRFTSHQVGTGDAWWMQVARASGELFPFLAVGLLAIFVLGGRRLLEDLRSAAGRHAQHRYGAAALSHLLSLTLFYSITARVFEGDLHASATPAAWIVAWLAAGVATLGSWLWMLLPAAVLTALAKRHASVLVASAFVAVGAYFVGGFTGRYWDPLAYSTLSAVRHQLSLLASDVVFFPDERILGTARFHVRIDYQCSGYEGIGLIWVFVASYLCFFRSSLRFPHSLLLIPIGTVLMWLANTVRLTGLIAIGTWGSPQLAMEGFHSRAGWILFCCVALGLVALTQRMRFFAKAATTADPASYNPTAVYLAPFLIGVAIAFVAGAVTRDPAAFYPLQVAAVATALWLGRRRIQLGSPDRSAFAVAVGTAVFGLWLLLDSGQAGADTTFAPAWSGAWLALWYVGRLVGAVAVIPIAEELAFRSFLPRRLRTPDFESISLQATGWLPIVVASALFGLMHDRWIAGVVAGLAYALVAARRGNLTDAIVAHATTNALLFGYAAATDSWGIWS